MTDKELIKQEIERLKNHTLNIQKSKDGLVTSTGIGRVEAFNDILKFIDSLPEESGCEVNLTTKSDDFEKEIKNWIKTKHFVFTEIDEIIETARHFAEWQKQQMMKDAQLGIIEERADGLLGWNTVYGTDVDYRNYLLSHFKNGDKVKLIIVKEE